jgi:hypothetical protein
MRTTLFVLAETSSVLPPSIAQSETKRDARDSRDAVSVTVARATGSYLCVDFEQGLGS